MRAKIADILSKERRFLWYRINILNGVPEKELVGAQRAAEAHKTGTIPSLRYTENKPEWVLLFDHIKKGQIDPRDVKYMKRVDLEYLSGMSTNPPGLDDLQSAKLRENVARATSELNKRNSAKIAISAALAGAVVGSITTLLVSWMMN